jgi:hypothetical protein
MYVQLRCKTLSWYRSVIAHRDGESVAVARLDSALTGAMVDGSSRAPMGTARRECTQYMTIAAYDDATH